MICNRLSPSKMSIFEVASLLRKKLLRSVNMSPGLYILTTSSIPSAALSNCAAQQL